MTSYSESIKGGGWGDFMDLSAGRTSPHTFKILESELSPDEFRSFIKSLFTFGLEVAQAGGSLTKEKMEILLKFVPAKNKEDFFSMLGIEDTESQ